MEHYFENIPVVFKGEQIDLIVSKLPYRHSGETIFLIKGGNALVTQLCNDALFRISSLSPADEFNYENGIEKSTDKYSPKQWEVFKIITTAIRKHFYPENSCYDILYTV